MKNLNQLILGLLLLPMLLKGQWMTQTVTLQPGWNSVYLEVDPLPRECSTIFNGVDIASVWAAAAQYPMDTIIDEWLTYYPVGSSSTTTLFSLQGGKSYSIDYEGAVPLDLELSGKPVLPQLTWESGEYQETGFHIDPTDPPTFSDFLDSAPEFGSNAIERMNTNGDWTTIADTETVQEGVAYRLKTDAFSNYTAPFTVITEQNNNLGFGLNLSDQLIRFANHTDAVKQLSILPLPSEDNIFAPYNLAGEVALNYWDTDNLEWVSLDPGLTLDVPARGEMALRVGVDRLEMPFSLHGLYQNLLQVKDGEGTEMIVPVSSFGQWNRTGLWVGTAVIDKVSYVNFFRNIPLDTPSEFVVKLIVHIDNTGQARLLDQVIQMWYDGSYAPDSDDPLNQTVDVPGQYILITDDDLLPLYSGAAIRDGQEMGRRISSAFFSFDEPQLLNGILGGTLEDTILLDYNDPVNPFQHKHHPDHNNLDENYEEALPEGIESYSVSREIQLGFSTNDPDNLSIVGFGDNQVGGIYSETVRGIHKKPIYVSGSFRLHRVSNIGKLNEPSTPTQIMMRKPVPLDQIAKMKEKEKLQVLPKKENSDQIPLGKVHPNPVENELWVTGIEEGEYMVTIRDISGKTMISREFISSDQINVGRLIPGMYTLELSNGEFIQHIKFIKQ